MTQGTVIRSITTTIVDIPMRRLQRFAALGARLQSFVVVEIQTEDGVLGIGEATTPSGPWWGGESVETIKLMIDRYFAPLLLGQSVFSMGTMFDAMDQVVYGNSFAKAGVEMALLDAQARHLGVPLYQLFGGKRRDSMACSWPLATGDADQEIEEAQGMIADGRHNIFKLKLGALPPEIDVARACQVARGLEGRASVRVDPNERWPEAVAKWAIPQMVDAGVELIEQPLARQNLEGAARLCAGNSVPIMADESVCTPTDMLHVAQCHAADVVSLKIMKSGGLRPSKSIADIAEAAGVSLYMGTFLESSLGTAANMQLAVTLPDLPLGGELSGPGLISDDVVTEPAIYKDFALQLPDGPGIGAQIDRGKFKHYSRDD